ncbi:hypothetical protein NQ317_009384 [Molorchus minor]|uniref:Uncharacterized protein n=1 Tax=Molorchus minor TaxID=1323400 RepID=A0ABQ9JSY8_9CUCU|nr:hypothetical protein NQ317_009384 [Molorchus minor]
MTDLLFFCFVIAYKWLKKGIIGKLGKLLIQLLMIQTRRRFKWILLMGGHYDQSNALALPSKKRKTKIKSDKPKVTRILSKKHRKKLEKIIERKKKKENRASLLESLQKVQASNEELSQLTSIASIQTKGLKRFYQEEINPQKVKPKRDLDILNGEAKLNSLSGTKRRKLLENTNKSKTDDPNVVGFEQSESETNESEDEDEETGFQEIEKQIKEEEPQINQENSPIMKKI